MDLERFTVPIEKLRWLCDPCRFGFESTTETAPLNEFIGQERAIRAIEFGLNLPNAGYNIYVAGLTGTGKKTIVKNYIEKLIREKAEEQQLSALDDWCYLHNFKEPDRPQIFNLPQGMGRKFRERLSGLLTRLREELGRAFSTEDYQRQKKQVIDEGKAKQQQIFEETAETVSHAGFFLQMTNMGPVVIPIVDGRPMEDKEYIALDENTRKELDAKR